MKAKFVGGIVGILFLGLITLVGCSSDSIDGVVSPESLSGEPLVRKLLVDTPPEIWLGIEEALKQTPTREFVSAAPMSAGYNRSAAVNYALRWALSRNPEYVAYNADCANFVSQCLRAGNRPFRGNVQDEWSGWWYCSGCEVRWGHLIDTNSRSWRLVGEFVYYLVVEDPNNTYYYNQSSKASDLQKGDVIVYDFWGGNYWDHTTFVTDIRSGKPYVSYHTTDTKNKAWDTISHKRVLFFHIY